MITLRTATYNIEMGGKGREAALLDVLRQSNADIIGLTEADDENVVRELAQALGMTYCWARGSGDRHVATLSRYSIIRSEIYNKKPLTQAALSTTIALPFRQLPQITIYNVHLRPDPFWHFEALRWLAVLQLRRVIKRENAGTHLIMGDLNTYAPKDPVNIKVLLRFTSELDRKRHARQRYKFLRIAHRQLIRAGYTDCYRRLNPIEKGYSFTRHTVPMARMDFVLADSSLRQRLTQCDVQTASPAPAASDHFPIVAAFQIAG